MREKNEIKYNEKSSRRRKYCALASKAEPKISPRHRPPSRGRGTSKTYQLEMVTTFTYKPGLVRIDARNFELSW